MASGAPAEPAADSVVPPPKSYVFSLDRRDLITVVGEPTLATFAKGDTPYEVARRLDLGLNELTDAFPDLDLFEVPEGTTLAFPTWWVLPEGAPEGIIINVPEMRLYYFPKDANPRTVITYPIGLGRLDWRTPMGPFKIIDKDVDPAWYIPDTIREEHIRERGDPRRMIPGGHPDNPLGRYRLRMDLPLYGIHGTNIDYGIGMQVTHGCIRLYPPDIEQLFAAVPLGTTGEIVYQPVKIGARGGDIYVEALPDLYTTFFDYPSAAARLLEDKGWSNLVNWDRLMEALEAKRGVPTRITDHWWESPKPTPEPTPAEQSDTAPANHKGGGCAERSRPAVSVRADPARLTWSLFRPVDAMPEASEDAQIASEMSFPQGLRVEMAGGRYRMPSFTITVTPEATQTMVLRSATRSDELLRHEQGHNDLVVLAARALAREIESMSARSAEELSQRVQECVTKHTERARQLSLAYDRQTDRSRNTAAQARWLQLIADALAHPSVAELAGMPL